MNFPFKYKLKRPLYKYSEAGDQLNQDKLRGLLQNSPLKEARSNVPDCIFVFTEDDRDHANQLYIALKNGIASFPGCKKLAGVNLTQDTVEAIRVPKVKEEDQAKVFYDTIENHLEKRRKAPDFAFTLYSKQPPPAFQDPYQTIKVALTKRGIPSQYVSWELLDSPNQFRYAISNIALSFFVKLGGVPWSISLTRHYPTLVFGIGSVETHDPNSDSRRRWTGFAICVLSDGLFQDASFFAPSISYSKFLRNLKEGLQDTLTRTLEKFESIEKLTIHVSRFERIETVNVIRNTIKNFDKSSDETIPFEIIRITEDSDFTVYDYSHPGYVSEEGTIVALGQNHALIVTEGRREKAVWRGRKPVTLELHRHFSSHPSLNLRDSIEDAFSLSSVNWRGFNVITQPISLQYAKLLTEQVAKMAHVEPNICAFIQKHHVFNSVPWFI